MGGEWWVVVLLQHEDGRRDGVVRGYVDEDERGDDEDENADGDDDEDDDEKVEDEDEDEDVDEEIDEEDQDECVCATRAGMLVMKASVRMGMRMLMRREMGTVARIRIGVTMMNMMSRWMMRRWMRRMIMWKRGDEEEDGYEYDIP